jgi:hypothetical protein
MLAILQSSIEPSPLTTPSACPEALLAEGFTGKLPMLDGEIGRPAHHHCQAENRRSAFRFVKWSPRPEMDAETLEGSANRSSQLRGTRLSMAALIWLAR